jgi:small subunit ribosomal protein S3
MGHKISVNLFRAYERLSKVENNPKDPAGLQRSVWYANKRGYSKLLLQDKEIRKYLENQTRSAGLVQCVIKRYVRRVEIVLYVTKPGIVIGKSGISINKLKDDLVKKFSLPKDLKINIEEFKDPNKSANVIANEISIALKKNVPYRKLVKTFMERIRYSGVLGAKITVKGRLNKAEIARKEDFTFGSIPRHTINSQLDYSLVHCRTSAGVIGIKVLLYKGDKITNYTY